MQARLLADKLLQIEQEIQLFRSKKKCTKRELLSLIGRLSFACKVVPTGRIFLRCLIDKASSVSHLHHHLHLNLEDRADLTWWKEFLPSWNGSSLFVDSEWASPESMQLFTDAAGAIGYGAYWDGHWFCGTWPPHLIVHPIIWKELFPIYIACSIWGPQ